MKSLNSQLQNSNKLELNVAYKMDLGETLYDITCKKICERI